MPRRPVAGRSRLQQGSAIVDFTLVSVVLIPLVFGVLQLALIWHVKNTLTAAASEGAHYGAAYDKTALDGGRRTRAVVLDVFGADFEDRVSARDTTIGGQPAVEVDVAARVPVLAFWGPTIRLEVSGHAVRERLP
ncbi:MAG: TadE/TadG family type IV pilus assembly protein [Nocardioidaceae bacterium]